jgi:DNA invertase Pin-like site-specific DNA recombinase
VEKPVKKGDFVTKKEAGISVTHSHAVTHGHAITHGYARCSTNEDRQDIDRQTRELKKHGAEKVWLEYEHGDAASKEQQALMLETARPGDTIVTLEVSRLARSTKQLCEIIDIIREKRLRLVIVGSITLDCRNGNPDPMTEAFLQIAGVFSQLELSMIRSRVRSGVENARAKGKRLGRPPVCAERVPEQFLRYYPRYQSGSINISELARLAQVSRPTAYRYLKALT